MSLMTLTTVGYGEIEPLSHTGKIFAIAYMLLAIGLTLYMLTNIADLVFQLATDPYWAIQKELRKVQKLKNHIIVCGYGRIGEEVCRLLQEASQIFVLIETDEERILRAREKKYKVLEGDASWDEVLLQAGVQQAAHLLCVTSDDATNLYITLSARELNPSLHIVARSNTYQNDKKVLRAGANEVLNPHHAGAVRLAEMLLNSRIHFGEMAYCLEELEIEHQSAWCGRAVRDFKQYQVTVLAVQRAAIVSEPTPEMLLQAEDTLLVVGTAAAIAQIRLELQAH